MNYFEMAGMSVFFGFMITYLAFEIVIRDKS